MSACVCSWPDNNSVVCGQIKLILGWMVGVGHSYFATRWRPDLSPRGDTSEQRERWADDTCLGMWFCTSEVSSVLPLGGAQICLQGAPLTSNASDGWRTPVLVSDSARAKRAVSRHLVEPRSATRALSHKSVSSGRTATSVLPDDTVTFYGTECVLPYLSSPHAWFLATVSSRMVTGRHSPQYTDPISEILLNYKGVRIEKAALYPCPIIFVLVTFFLPNVVDCITLSPNTLPSFLLNRCLVLLHKTKGWSIDSKQSAYFSVCPVDPWCWGSAAPVPPTLSNTNTLSECPVVADLGAIWWQGSYDLPQQSTYVSAKSAHRKLRKITFNTLFVLAGGLLGCHLVAR